MQKLHMSKWKLFKVSSLSKMPESWIYAVYICRTENTDSAWLGVALSPYDVLFRIEQRRTTIGILSSFE